MFVCTQLARESKGQSTDMHSKAGKYTICNYQQFVDVNRKIPGIKESQVEKKHNTIIEYLSYVPDKLQEQIQKTNIDLNVSQVVYNKIDEIKAK